MNEDPRTQPLQEWNRLARANTENAIVSSMFEATLKASEPIESFCNWLLLATAAVASFVLANTDKIVPLVGKAGFTVGGVLLCISCVFGLISRVFALRCRIGLLSSTAIKATFEEHLAKYKEEEAKIKDGAKFWGITLQTGIGIQRVLQEFLSPFPFWVRWVSQRYFTKHAGNPQIGYISQVKSLNAQGLAAFLQALSFICFFGVAFIYGAAI
jgi:hypothetical protein